MRLPPVFARSRPTGARPAEPSAAGAPMVTPATPITRMPSSTFPSGSAPVVVSTVTSVPVTSVPIRLSWMETCALAPSSRLW